MALASDRVLVQNLPYWKRSLGVSDSGIAVFVFYRPVEYVPRDFDLIHDFFDFTIPEDAPLLVQGFALVDEGFPKQVVLENAEGSQVVICFVDVEDLPPLTGTLTIDELLDMPSLRIGQASFYREALHPDQMVEIVAQGVLEDGRSFFVTTPNGPTIVRIGD